MIDIYKEAIAIYGRRNQMNIAIEEMAELTKEICKNKRGFANRDNIIEEMTDVYIMLEQLEIIFDIDISEIIKMKEFKLNRLAERLDRRSF